MQNSATNVGVPAKFEWNIAWIRARTLNSWVSLSDLYCVRLAGGTKFHKRLKCVLKKWRGMT